MDAYLLDWANLLLRWAHVIVAIAWIGSSFYFVFLDNSLTPPEDPALRGKVLDGLRPTARQDPQPARLRSPCPYRSAMKCCICTVSPGPSISRSRASML